MVREDEFDFWPPIHDRDSDRDPSISRSIHGAYHALERRLTISTREHGLGPSEAMVLAYLLRDSGCAAANIRHALGFHRSTLSSLLDRLEGKNLFTRAASAFDGRRLEVRLTEGGRNAAEIADYLIRDVEAEIAIFTSKAERRGARSVFEACVAINRPGESLDL